MLFRSEAAQNSSDLTGSASMTNSRMQQSLRYQATSNETVLQQSFEQRLGSLDYDLGRTISRRSRLNRA